MNYFLESDRIYLRAVDFTDVNENYVSWMNDPEINQFMETRFRPWTETSIKEYVFEKSNSKNEFFFAICLKPINQYDSCHIGNIKLGPLNWIHRRGDISLFIGRKDLWGKGYATEAIKLVVEFAFKRLNLHKVTAGIYQLNEASFKAFDKAGFREEGISQKEVVFDGKYINLWKVAKVNE